MVKYLYPFIFLLNCNLYSQIQIVGQVKNYINDTPIINAEVFIDNDLTTFSDSKGFFELFLDSRNFNLKLKHISYEDLSKYFSNVNDTLILFLNPKNFELETITVSTNKFEKKIQKLTDQNIDNIDKILLDRINDKLGKNFIDEKVPTSLIIRDST